MRLLLGARAEAGNLVRAGSCARALGRPWERGGSHLAGIGLEMSVTRPGARATGLRDWSRCCSAGCHGP